MTDAAATLARLYLQTLGLSLLFAGAGHFIYRAVRPELPEARSEPVESSALRWGRGYFLGITAFLPVFLFLSRAIGAHAALWVAIALMGAASILALRPRRAPFSPAATLAFLGTLLALIAFYSVTTVALWIGAMPASGDAGLLSHFGSIHAGRYANYAVFIAEHDRVPFLAQNGGQSMLASLHLLLGLDRPLAALTVWLPCSIAFLTLLVFGLMRSAGFGRGACAAATFLVMFCNVAVSSIHVLVFDNGSPLAFIGYTDMVIAVATFVLFARWLVARMLSGGPWARRELVLPALLGLTWAWYAPQNVVIGALACSATVLVWMRTGAAAMTRRAFAEIGLAFALALVLGATQFGSFLPHALREDTGLWTQEVKSTLEVRPYVNYMRSHWTLPRWKEAEPGVYENVYAYNKPLGRDEIYRNFAWLAEENLWASLRAYGFAVMGLALMFAWLRRSRGSASLRWSEWRLWWLMSLFAFGAGYAITYTFELGGMKWWLTRFLVPGSAMALVCLALVALEFFRGLAAPACRALWAALLLAATVGPVTELGAVTYRNFIAVAQSDPIAGRLAVLLGRKGPFLFETLTPENGLAERGTQNALVVGGGGRPEGLAVQSPPMPMPRGRYRVGYEIEAPNAARDAALAELDVVDANGARIAKRAIDMGDLQVQGDRRWAWMEVEFPQAARDVRFRIWSRSPAAFKVLAMRLERQ